MMLRIALFSLLMFSGMAAAQQNYPRDITISWLNADSYEDVTLGDGTVVPGGLIEPGDLAQVRVECFRQNDTTPSFVATVPVTGEGQPQSETFAGAIPRPGTYTCFGYSILFNDVESVASDPSNAKKYTGRPFPPQAFD